MKGKIAFVACLASAFVLASCGARAATPEEMSSYSAEQSKSAEEASKSAAASTSADPAPTSSSPATSSSTDPAPSSSSPATSSSTDPAPSSSSSDPSSSSSSDPVSYNYFVSVGGATKIGLAASTQTLVTGQTGEYYANEVTVAAGDSITFFSGELAISSNIGSDPQGEGTDGKMHYNNGVVTEDPFSITIHDSGSVSIYLKTWDGGGYSFWITGHTKDGSDPEPVASGFGVKLGIADIVDLTQDTEKVLAQNQTGEYYLKGVSLTKDEAVVFYKGTDAITANIGSDAQGKGSDGKMHYNNGVVTWSPFGIAIHNDAASADIYLKTWKDGGYSFWITGHEDDGSDPVADERTYYFSKPKENWGADVYVYFYETEKTKWPGDKLESIGTNEYGESIYSFTVDVNEHAKAVINNGGDSAKTVDIALASLTNNGIFINGAKADGKYPVGSYEYNPVD